MCTDERQKDIRGPKSIVWLLTLVFHVFSPLSFSASILLLCTMSYELWFGEEFKDCYFTFPDGSQWAVGKKICEKVFLDQEGCEREDGITVKEAQAVFHCRQRGGPSAGDEAIMEIRMQYVYGSAQQSIL